MERNNYLSWSELIEEATQDLMKEEADGTIKFSVCGDTARGATKSMYNFPTDSIYDKLEAPILLLQTTLPASWNEVRNLLVREFLKGTNVMVKRVEATRLIHWNNSFLIAEEVVDWMK